MKYREPVGSRFVLVALTLALGLLLSWGPSNSVGDDAKDESPASKVFVGALKGGPVSARIAIAIQEGKILAYVCSSDETFNENHSRWFPGKFAGDGSFSAKVE